MGWNWEEKISEILADGVVDAAETAELEKEVYADGVAELDEARHLITIRNGAKETCPEFEVLTRRVVKEAVLADGVVDNEEVEVLHSYVYGNDNVMDDEEGAFINEIKSEADSYPSEIDSWK